jgi:hypothetical protein
MVIALDEALLGQLVMTDDFLECSRFFGHRIRLPID